MAKRVVFIGAQLTIPLTAGHNKTSTEHPMKERRKGAQGLIETAIIRSRLYIETMPGQLRTKQELARLIVSKRFLKVKDSQH